MREPTEFIIGAHTYRSDPMDAMAQQHVARRVTPLLVSLIPALVAAIPAGKMEPGALLDLKPEAIMGSLTKPAELLAQMSDETYDYVQAKCLARVRRQKAGDTGWAPIWSAQAGRLMFDDIEGHEIQAIVLKVLTVELGPFFLGLVSNFSEAGPA